MEPQLSFELLFGNVGTILTATCRTLRFIAFILPSAAERAAVTMSGKDLMSTLRRFDAYPKTLEDFRVKTFGGAAGKCYVITTVADSRFSGGRTGL